MTPSETKGLTMNWFTITQRVPKGQGDYGSDHKTLFDGKTTQRQAEQQAQSFANLFRAEISLFKGKTIGRLVAQYGTT